MRAPLGTPQREFDRARGMVEAIMIGYMPAPKGKGKGKGPILYPTPKNSPRPPPPPAPPTPEAPPPAMPVLPQIPMMQPPSSPTVAQYQIHALQMMNYHMMQVMTANAMGSAHPFATSSHEAPPPADQQFDMPGPPDADIDDDADKDEDEDEEKDEDAEDEGANETGDLEPWLFEEDGAKDEDADADDKHEDAEHGAKDEDEDAVFDEDRDDDEDEVPHTRRISHTYHHAHWALALRAPALDNHGVFLFAKTQFSKKKQRKLAFSKFLTSKFFLCFHGWAIARARGRDHW